MNDNDFKPCPNYDGYEVTLDGTIRRMAHTRLTKLGTLKTVEAREIKHVGRGMVYVTLQGRFVRWHLMVADAWGDDVEEANGRPRSSYRDGRCLSVKEWVRLMRGSSC